MIALAGFGGQYCAEIPVKYLANLAKLLEADVGIVGGHE